MSGQTNKLKSDLVIGLGFSKDNADTAIAAYISGQLTQDEDDAIYYLIRKEPFSIIGQPHIVLPDKYIQVLEHLNYKIEVERNGR